MNCVDVRLPCPCTVCLAIGHLRELAKCLLPFTAFSFVVCNFDSGTVSSVVSSERNVKRLADYIVALLWYLDITTVQSKMLF